MHYSNQIGQGIVFSDRRTYIQGDDSKNIDWNIMEKPENFS